VRCYFTSTTGGAQAGQGRGLKVITDPKEWASIAERGPNFTLPLMVYPDYTFPYVTLHFAPTPSVNAVVLLDVLNSFSTFAPDTPATIQSSTQNVTMRGQIALTLTAGTSQYQVGPGATASSGIGALANVTRPAQILAASAANAGSSAFRHSIDVVGSLQWEQQIEPDGTPLALPMAAYVTYGFPNATVYLWPPAGSNVTAEVQHPQQMAQFTGLSQNIYGTLPPAWLDMLHFALAVKLYPEYRRSQGIPNELVANAQDAMQKVIAANVAAGVYVPPGAPPQAPPGTPPGSQQS
jgi:hypothetical protein